MVGWIKRALMASLFAAVAAVGLSGVALAEEFSCTGSVGAVTLDDIRVPDNASCTLTGTQAEGNIFVGTNATLVASGVRVGGNIQAEGAARVDVLADSQVIGSIQIKQGGSARVETATIDSDLQFDANSASVIAAFNNIGGNLQAFSNSGGVSVTDNTIDGNLQCKENIPAPTGARNNVQGSAEDQCASFTGTPGTPTPVTPAPTPVTPAPTPVTPAPTPVTPAPDEDLRCTTAYGAVTVDNIIVPDNATCTLDGTRAGGNIIVGTNSTLIARLVRVDGNIQAEGSSRVDVLANSRVIGNIQIKQGGSARVETVTINGDLQVEDNTAGIVASFNDIGGNLQAFQNRNGVSITDNTIDGNLQCKENVPAPTGARNNVQGSAEDQCASFTGAPRPPASATPAPVTPAPPTPTPTVPAPSPDEDFRCTGVVMAITLDNIRVPDNATCTLEGTRARGNIFVGTNATLIANAVRVGGNIQAEGAARVDVLNGSFVDGSVQIKQGGSARVEWSTVDSDLQLEDNRGAISAAANIVGGNLQAFQNRGGVAVTHNTIDGNLQCKENVPAPTGSGNLVRGSAEDQCAGFTGTPNPPAPPEFSLAPPNWVHVSAIGR